MFGNADFNKKLRRCRLRSIRLTRFVSRHVPCSSFDGLCFGAPAHQHEEHGWRSVYHFHPTQIFGVLWWRRHSPDRQHRAIAIVQALGADQIGYEVPGVNAPVAVHAIVDQHGPAGEQDGAVDLLLDLIQNLKVRGQKAETLSPSYWIEAVRHIQLHHVRSTSNEGTPCAT
jgi:hypothetical protein